MERFAIIASFLIASAAHAAPLKKKDLSLERVRELQQHQREAHRVVKPKAPPEDAPARPFSEVEKAGYLFFSADNNFDSRHVKETMAANLPDGVTLVIFADQWQDKTEILERYRGVVDLARVKVIEIPGARSGFWTRDGFPIPVWNKTDGMDLVNARYYHGFEPDRDIAGKFGARLRDHAYYFEGGNFMVNDLGDCLTIDNDLSSDIPIEVFMDTYGCARTIRLTHLKGIGHADESVRFLKSKVVVTDTPDYVGELEHSGFEVLELPRPSHPYETYVNSLLVNDTVFVPVFNEPSDEQALDVYRGQGLNVVPVETIELANEGLGSIHCITMTYPNVPFATLLRQLGAREL